MSNSDYVTSDAWVRQIGRPDLIDEVATTSERPAAVESQAAWTASAAAETRWPRTSRGWRSRDLLTHRTPERRSA